MAKKQADSFRPLVNYIPENAWPLLKGLLDQFTLQVKISKPRKTKIGDYRPASKHQPHRISINNDLNPYAFLLTFIHELAHLQTYEQYKNKVKPHGRQWKANFQRMLDTFLKAGIFPLDVEKAVKSYINNPAAASCTDTNLARALQQYDEANPHFVTLEELPRHGLFQWRNGRVFKKENRLRKRYRCIEIQTNRYYLFSPVAEVLPLEGG